VAAIPCENKTSKNDTNYLANTTKLSLHSSWLTLQTHYWYTCCWIIPQSK